MIQVLIIEDEEIASGYLISQIKKIKPEWQICKVIDNVMDTVQYLNVNVPDLIFCDIHLADGNSFSIFEQIQCNVPVIFTTAYDNYAVKAFKINSIDYLLKPINPTELKSAIDKFESRNSSQNLQNFSEILKTFSKQTDYKQRFVVSAGDKLLSIKVEDIAYFFAEDKYTFLVSNTKNTYDVSNTLEQLEDMLNPKKFYRVNRKFIVNLEAISGMNYLAKSRIALKLTPPPTEEILVSLNKTNEFKTWLEG